MALWIVIAAVLLLVVLARADSRDRSNRPKRSWNIWFGPTPREGESRARYTGRRALAALAALVFLGLPLAFVSPPLDEGTRLSGDESIVDLAVFMIFMPLTAMAFVSFVALIFSSMVSAVFRRGQLFDSAAGDFVGRSPRNRRKQRYTTWPKISARSSAG